MEYFYKRYFLSSNMKDKKYYFNLFLNNYFKKINYDETDLLKNYISSKKIYYDNKVENIIFQFETKSKFKA